MQHIRSLTFVFILFIAGSITSCSDDVIVDPGIASKEFVNFGAPSSVVGNRIVKTKDGNLLLATGGGLFRYKFSSSAWEIVGNGDMYQHNIEDVAVLQNGNIVCGSPSRALFVSTDNGDSWKTTLVSNTLKGIRFYVGNRFEVWAVIKGEDGKYTAQRSEDFGNTWAQRVTPKNAPETRISLCFNDTDHVFFANDEGLHRSLDSGRTYKKMNTKSDIQMMAVNSSGEMLLFDGATGAIATDSGRLVTAASLPANVTEAIVTESGKILATQANPSGALYESNDGGHTWSKMYGFSRPLTGVAAVNSNYYVSSQGLGVLSGSGSNWVGIGPGISTIYGLAVDNSDNLLAASYGMFVTANGSGWTSFGTNTELSTAIAFSQQGISARVTNGSVHVSTDGGALWTQIPGITSATAVAFFPNGNGVIGTNTMLTSITLIPPSANPLPLPGVTDIRALAISSSYSIYCAGIGSTGAGVWCSLDSGKTFSSANSGIENIVMSSMAISANGTVYASDGTMLYQSEDNGTSWTKYSITGLAGGDKVNAMTFRSDGKLYLGTNTAIIRSQDALE